MSRSSTRQHTRDSRAGFTGDDIARAVFHAEDDDYLVDRETTVTHHEVTRRLGQP